VGTLALLAALPRIAEHGCPAWRSRAGWLPISKQIVAEIGSRTKAARGNRDEAIVIVYGEPGLFFQLNVDGTQVIFPAADLSFINNPSRDTSVPTFLVTGPHAERTTGFWEDMAQHATSLEQIAGYEYIPSDLVLLDQYDARALAADGAASRTQRVTLYQVIHKSQLSRSY
jgi:hypothetical protein